MTPLTLACAALAVLLSACGDEVTDPNALLESAEAEAVMRSADALPSLGSLIDAAVPDRETDRIVLLHARDLWTQGTVSDDAAGRARRRLAVRRAAPVLARTIPEDHWVDVRQRTDDWIATADAMLQHLRLPEVDARVRAARGHLQRADASDDAGLAGYHLLLSTSELVETTPRFVARRLSRQAEAAVTRAEAAATDREDVRLERARRLNDWAARAVVEEEYLLAIQRAYYALELVEEREDR